MKNRISKIAFLKIPFSFSKSFSKFQKSFSEIFENSCSTHLSLCAQILSAATKVQYFVRNFVSCFFFPQTHCMNHPRIWVMLESRRVLFSILANPFCTSCKRRVRISPFYGKSTYLPVECFLCWFVAFNIEFSHLLVYKRVPGVPGEQTSGLDSLETPGLDSLETSARSEWENPFAEIPS